MNGSSQLYLQSITTHKPFYHLHKPGKRQLGRKNAVYNHTVIQLRIYLFPDSNRDQDTSSDQYIPEGQCLDKLGLRSSATRFLVQEERFLSTFKGIFSGI